MKILNVAFGLVALLVFGSFLSMLVWHWNNQGTVSGDTVIYFSVGRGLLNGLKLYTENFDIKPPLIFFLAASSLWLGESQLYFSFVLTCLLGIPLLLAAHFRRQDFLTIVTGTIFGMGIAMHTMVRGVFSQPELFGIFFCVIFFLTAQRAGKWAFLLSIVGAMGAIGMKEPFLLSLLAGSLVLSRDWRDFLKKYLAPIYLALLFGAIAMAILGMLEPYLYIYLPEVLYGRMVNVTTLQGSGLTVDTPLWLRALETRRLYAADAWDSPVPYLIYLCMALVAVLPALRAKTRSRGVLTFACTLSIGYLLQEYSTFLQIAALKGFTTELFSFFWFDFLLAGMTVVALWWANAKQVILCTVAFLLAGAAVGAAGNYQANHFLFAAPLYVAVFLSVMRHASARPLVSILTMVALVVAPSSYYLQKRHLVAVQPQDTTSALALDSLMDSCKMSLYLPWKDPIWPMKHSPYMQWHPIIRGFTSLFGNAPNVGFHQQYMRALKETQLFVLSSGEPAQEVQEVLNKEFTLQVPKCAINFIHKISFPLYFRK